MWPIRIAYVGVTYSYLDVGEWTDSRSVRFTSCEIFPSTHRMVGWLEPGTGLSFWKKRKIILYAEKWIILLLPIHGLVTTRAELFWAPKLRVSITNYLVSEPSRLQSEQSLKWKSEKLCDTSCFRYFTVASLLCSNYPSFSWYSVMPRVYPYYIKILIKTTRNIL
jgi:hypothetical protein